MTHDRTEQLIRDSFHDEAARAVDSREVLANVRGQKPRRSYGLVLATAAVVVVVAAVAAFVVPEVFQRSNGTPPVGDRQQEQTTAVTPTNVLVLGHDGRENIDSLVLTQLKEDGSANLVSLPRDSLVTAGGKQTKLGLIYRESGVEALLTTVRDLTGVTVDHYVVVDMAAVVSLTDTVGGVPVCLNAAVSDKFSGADFSAGEQTLNGEAALAFLRQRYGLPNGDLDRIARLQVFLRSLVVKLDGKHVPTLLTAVQEHVQTDPGLDAIGFVQALSGRLHVGTIPVGDVQISGPQGSGIEVDPAQVRQFVTDQLPNLPDGGRCVN